MSAIRFACPVTMPPKVGHILRLAEIIREVDGNHDKGAAALAEAILSHPAIRGAGWQPPATPPLTPEQQEALAALDRLLQHCSDNTGEAALRRFILREAG